VLSVIIQYLQNLYEHCKYCAALVAVMETLKRNPYGMNLLNNSSVGIENYPTTDNDGKSLLHFTESYYNNLLKSYATTIAQYE
jgi:hypothetical protein